jgi:hypothetical protein
MPGTAKGRASPYTFKTLECTHTVMPHMGRLRTQLLSSPSCHRRTWTRRRGGARSRRCSTPSSRGSASRGPSSRSPCPSTARARPCTPATPPRSCTTRPWPPCWPPRPSSTRRRTRPPWPRCRYSRAPSPFLCAEGSLQDCAVDNCSGVLCTGALQPQGVAAGRGRAAPSAGHRPGRRRCGSRRSRPLQPEPAAAGGPASPLFRLQSEPPPLVTLALTGWSCCSSSRQAWASSRRRRSSWR